MTTFVTGGAGCIGSELVAELIRKGERCIVYDNFSSGKIEHLKPFRDHPLLRIVEGNILDLELLSSSMSGSDFVWHFAANPDVKYTYGDPTDKDLRENVTGTHHVLESMRVNGVKELAFSSTSAVYGIVATLPISEHHPLVPISLYGASKAGCEALISSFSHLFGFQSRVFRLANIVGGKTRKRGTTVIFDFVQKLREDPRQLPILGNGRQAKSYLLVSDCISAMMHVVNSTVGTFVVYNVGASDSIPVNAIADMVVAELGLNGVNYSYTGTEGGWPGDVPAFELDVSALNRLGWRASCNSKQALKIAIRETIRNTQSQ